MAALAEDTDTVSSPVASPGPRGPVAGAGPDHRRQPPRPRARIGPRLTISFVALVVGVMGTSGLVLYDMTQRSLTAQMRDHLIAVAQVLSTWLSGDVVRRLHPGDETYSLHNRLTERLRQSKDVVGAERIYVFDREGRSLLDTELGTEGGWPIGREIPHLMIRDRREVERVLAGQPGASVLFYDAGQAYMTGYAPLRAQDEVVGAVGVDIGAGFVGTRHAFLRRMLMFAALGVLVTVVVALALARSITRPVQQLVRAAQQIGRGHLDHPVRGSAHDELGYLGETMEDMRRKLLARDAQLRQMLGGVAHEIRNPLGGIEVYAGLIAADLPEADARRQHIQKVIQEVRNLNSVISEFLDFARPASPSPRRVLLSRLIEDAWFLLAPEMDKSRVRFVRQLDEDLCVFVDAEQVKRALLNLMRNAVQAMRQGGTLTVRSRAVSGEALLEIEDTGIGMAPEVLARLFEPFFTTREKGSGLGLAVAMRTVEQNEGGMVMESTPGVGTVCRVRLPLAAGEGKAG